MKEEEIKLLERFIDGRCTAEELREVYRLLKSAPGHEMLDRLIEKRESFQWNNPPETDDVLQELLQARQIEMQERIEAYENRRYQTRGRIIRWGSYAAAFIGILVLTTFFWKYTRNGLPDFTAAPSYITLSNSGSLPERYLLPDSTKVYLAGGSTVKYPETFHKTKRTIELQGEAFFEVTPDQKRPFTIHSGSMETVVLGTSFRITAFEGEEQEVAVATGKVSVRSVSEGIRSEMALLTRGLKVRYNPQTGKNTQSEIDVYGLESWKTGALSFNEDPMRLVAQQLKRRFGIQLKFADQEVANHRVSGTFTSEASVTDILGMLGFVGKFRHESVDGKHFTIYLLKQ